MKALFVCSLLTSLQYCITNPLNARNQRRNSGNDITKAVPSNFLATTEAKTSIEGALNTQDSDVILSNSGNIYSEGKKGFSGGQLRIKRSHDIKSHATRMKKGKKEAKGKIKKYRPAQYKLKYREKRFSAHSKGSSGRKESAKKSDSDRKNHKYINGDEGNKNYEPLEKIEETDYERSSESSDGNLDEEFRPEKDLHNNHEHEEVDEERNDVFDNTEKLEAEYVREEDDLADHPDDDRWKQTSPYGNRNRVEDGEENSNGETYEEIEGESDSKENDDKATDGEAGSEEPGSEEADGEESDGEEADSKETGSEEPGNEETDSEEPDGEEDDGEEAGDEENDGEDSDGKETGSEKTGSEETDGKEDDGEEAGDEKNGDKDTDGEETDGEENDGEESYGEESDVKENGAEERDDEEIESEGNENEESYDEGYESEEDADDDENTDDENADDEDGNNDDSVREDNGHLDRAQKNFKEKRHTGGYSVAQDLDNLDEETLSNDIEDEEENEDDNEDENEEQPFPEAKTSNMIGDKSQKNQADATNDDDIPDLPRVSWEDYEAEHGEGMEDDVEDATTGEAENEMREDKRDAAYNADIDYQNEFENQVQGNEQKTSGAVQRRKRELQAKRTTSYENVDSTWLHESSKIVFVLDAVRKQILGTQKANISKLANVAVRIQGVLHEVCTVLKEFVKVKNVPLRQLKNYLKDASLVKLLFGNVTCFFSNKSDAGDHEDQVVLSKDGNSGNTSAFDTRNASNIRNLLKDQQKYQKAALKNSNANEGALRYPYKILGLKLPKQKIGKEDTKMSISKVAKDGKAESILTSQASDNKAKHGSLVDMKSGVTNVTIEFNEQEPIQILP